MSPLFLNIEPDDSVAVQIRKSTGLEIQNELQARIENKIKSNGYKIISLKNADFILRAHVQAKRLNKSAYEMYGGGTKETVGGAIAGGAAGAMQEGNPAILVGAAAGAVGGTILDLTANSMVKLNRIDFISNIQVMERTEQIIKTATKTQVEQGTASTEKQKYTEQSNYKKYATKVAVTAKQSGFKWKKSKEKILSSISGGIANVI